MALKSWFQAARAPAQINIALPLIFGQLLACKAAWNFRWDFALLLVLYGLVKQLYIVFWNDWADRDADKNTGKRTLATLIGAKHAAEFAVFLGVLAQGILFFAHPKDFGVLNLASLPLLASFFLLPKLTATDTTPRAHNTARRFLLAFVALTIFRSIFYVMAIYLHDAKQ